MAKNLKTIITVETISGIEDYVLENDIVGKTTINYDKNEIPRYGYVKKIAGKVGLSGNDYKKALAHINFDDCKEIVVKRYKMCEGDWSLIFDGVAYPAKAEIDLDRCMIYLQCEEISPYKCLDDNWEVEHNFLTTFGLAEKKAKVLNLQRRYKFHIRIVSDTDAVPVTVTVKNAYQIPTDSPNNIDGIASWTTDPIPGGDPLFIAINDLVYDFYNQYIRNIKTVITTPSIGFPRIRTDEDRYYVINQNADGTLSIADQKENIVNVYSLIPDPPVVDEPFTVYTKMDFNFVGLDSGSYNINNGRSLKEVFEKYLSLACDGMGVVSDFFQWNPENETTTNYVAGRENELMNLLIFQKSDVKRPNDLNKATAGLSTLKWFIETICKVFNCWYTIENGNLRIEHCTLFKEYPPGTLSLTTPEHEFFARGTNRYSYDYESIPKREQFKNMEAFGDDFVGVDIIYPQLCAGVGQKDVELTTTVSLTTDVIACIDGEPSWYSFGDLTGLSEAEALAKSREIIDKYISDEGFVIMACEVDIVGTMYPVHRRAGILGVGRPNNVLSWAHLHTDYYRTGNRYLPSGTMNNVTNVNFLSIRPYKVQENVKFIDCCGKFDPTFDVATGLGMRGKVESADYNPVSGVVNLKLKHR